MKTTSKGSQFDSRSMLELMREGFRKVATLPFPIEDPRLDEEMDRVTFAHPGADVVFTYAAAGVAWVHKSYLAPPPPPSADGSPANTAAASLVAAEERFIRVHNASVSSAWLRAALSSAIAQSDLDQVIEDAGTFLDVILELADARRNVAAHRDQLSLL